MFRGASPPSLPSSPNCVRDRMSFPPRLPPDPKQNCPVYSNIILQLLKLHFWGHQTHEREDEGKFSELVMRPSSLSYPQGFQTFQTELVVPKPQFTASCVTSATVRQKPRKVAPLHSTYSTRLRGCMQTRISCSYINTLYPHFCVCMCSVLGPSLQEGH